MVFNHSALNEMFGFDKKHEIPFVCINNPFIYMTEAEEQLKLRDSTDTWKISTLKDLM
jgi:predicted transcriptional regulator